MKLNRVVITGVGAVSAFGRDWASVQAAFVAQHNAVRIMPEYDEFVELEAKLAAPLATPYSAPAHWSRKQLRSMGLVAQYTVDAAEQALTQAGLRDDASIRDGRMGVAAGSSSGSPQDILDVGLLLSHLPNHFNANTYVRMMPHTTAANVAIFFGLTGRLIPTSSACTSGSQGIGYAYEAIKYGKIPMMLAGGSEELSASQVLVFDSLYAASRCRQPALTPRPYDRDRDGLVIGEGACMMVLESLEHAQARGAKIIAEIVGYGANSDGSHITRPERDTMQRCMELALADANLPASAIGYVSGHGTATEQGDIAETQATANVLGHVPLSSQKSYLGHTLGACGALESWFSIEMMRQKWFAPTLNLDNIDERCGDVDYIRGAGRSIDTEFVMNNNFAFGGVNTSLIFKRW